MHNESFAAVGSICSGVVTIFGVVMQSLGDASVPWDKVSGLGAGGLVLFVTWFFMRRDEVVRKENHEATKAIVTEFSTTTKAVTDKFAVTTETMIREAREDAKQREAQLVALFAQFHKDKA